MSAPKKIIVEYEDGTRQEAAFEQAERYGTG